MFTLVHHLRLVNFDIMRLSFWKAALGYENRLAVRVYADPMRSAFLTCFLRSLHKAFGCPRLRLGK